MWAKAADDYSVALEFVPDQYKTKEMCNRIISDDPFSLRYVSDQYKTQQMCDKAVDDFLPTLNFVPNWFVASKMIKKLFTALHPDENILYFDEDFGNVVFNYNEMGNLNLDLNCINLDNNNFGEDDSGTIMSNF